MEVSGEKQLYLCVCIHFHSNLFMPPYGRTGEAASVAHTYQECMKAGGDAMEKIASMSDDDGESVKIVANALCNFIAEVEKVSR